MNMLRMKVSHTVIVKRYVEMVDEGRCGCRSAGWEGMLFIQYRPDVRVIEPD